MSTLAMHSLLADFSNIDSLFNSDFYVTAATIIPVLYLALTLQGSTFDQVLSWWIKFVARQSKASKRAGMRSFIAIQVMVLVAPLFIVGLVAEIDAIQDLYSRNPGLRDGQFILITIIALTSVVIAVTAWRFFAAFIKSLLAMFDPAHKDVEPLESEIPEGEGNDA